MRSLNRCIPILRQGTLLVCNPYFCGVYLSDYVEGSLVLRSFNDVPGLSRKCPPLTEFRTFSLENCTAYKVLGSRPSKRLPTVDRSLAWPGRPVDPYSGVPGARLRSLRWRSNQPKYMRTL